LVLVNDFLGYLADRGYSPRTVRSYAYDLLAFLRWLDDERLAVDEVGTEGLLRFLTFCRIGRRVAWAVRRSQRWSAACAPTRIGRSPG